MWRQCALLRGKIGFWLICNALLLTVFCIPLWGVWTGTMLTGRIDSLHVVANRMSTVFDHRGPQVLAMEIDDWVRNDDAAFGLLLQLNGPGDRRLAGNVRAVPTGVPNEDGVYDMPATADQPAGILLSRDLPGGYRLLVGKDMTRFNRLETIFVRGMIGTTLITVAIAFAAAWAARRSMLDRVDMTSRTMAAIVEGDLSRRLHVSRRGDEFDVLARTVNGMLEQLDTLVQNVKHSSNAIAHDLRTPLAELRADLERLAIEQPTPDDMLNGIEVAIGDVDRVIAIFNALLRLAEIDSGTRRAGFKRIDVAATLEDTADFYAPVAEDAGILLDESAEPGLIVLGDAVLLAQAIGNLIDNALKYGAGGRVSMRAHRNVAGQVQIMVADRGPGIPDTEKSKVISRFYRLDSGQTSPGMGLGLALVTAVAKLHGGTFELQDNGPGLRATLTLAGDGIGPA